MTETINHLFEELKKKKFNIKTIESIIKQNPGLVNAADAFGRTPLHFAIHYNNITLTEFLISKGADLNTKNILKQTPLDYANDEIKTLIQKLKQQLVILFAELKKKESNIKTIESIIKQNPRLVNTADVIENTPLHYAADHNNIALIKFLISKGADLNTKNILKQTPLYYAKNDKIKTLINNKLTELLFEELNKEKPDINIVKSIIEQNIELLNARDCCNGTVLHCAVDYEDEEVIKYIIDQNPELVNIKDKEGKTPLHWAVDNCRELPLRFEGNPPKNYDIIGIVKLLILNCADVNIKDNKGNTPLDYTANDEIRTLINKELLFIELKKEEPDTEIIESILKQNPKLINARDENGNTPLHYVLKSFESKKNEFNTISLIYTFVSNGAILTKEELGTLKKENNSLLEIYNTCVSALQELTPPTTQVEFNSVFANSDEEYEEEEYEEEYNKLTKLLFAELKKEEPNIETIESILKQNPKLVHARDNEGKTPLYYVLKSFESKKNEFNTISVIYTFVSNGALLTEEELGTLKNNSLLEIYERCLIELKQSFLKELDQSEPDINKIKSIIEKNPYLAKAKYDEEWTVLHWAAFKNLKDVVELLISKGEYVDVKSCYKLTPLHYAVKGNNINIVELLINKGVNVNIKDNKGNTPLDYAKNDEMKELINNKLTELLFIELKKEEPDTEIIECIIDQNPELVHAKNKLGLTHLDYAKENSKVEKLINNKLTELLFAELKKEEPDTEIIESILEQNPELVHVRDNEGNTPLHLATNSNFLNIARLLVLNDANVNATNKNNSIPLHFAVKNGSVEVVELLMAFGANVNAVDNKKCTPLYFAVCKGYKNIEKLLMANDAKLNNCWEEEDEKSQQLLNSLENATDELNNKTKNKIIIYGK